jgi:serine-type D-Ala-D-Ala carboxypeptidase/endopeptidase
MLKTTITFLVWIVFTVNTNAQSAIPEAVKNNIKERVDNGNNVSIVLGIIDANGTQYFSYGVKSLKSKEVVTENSIFEIGSITKTFTGILLADMVINGDATLEDPIQKYLPAGVTAPTRNGATINLVHLANHTSSLSGLPDNFKPANLQNPYVDYSEKQLYEFLNGYALTRDIGSAYEYSNYAVGLLGHILAVKKGTTYEQLLVNVIAKPLNLANTRISLTSGMKANLAVGHIDGVEVANWDFPTLAGAGAIRSNAVDMLKYLAANMGQNKTKLYPAMQLSHKNSRVADSKPMVGLGWHIAQADALTITWHNGGTGGYRSFIGFTNKGKGVVVLTNSTTSVDDIGMHLLNPTSPLKPIVKEIVVDTATLEGYVGKYELAPGFILTVSREGAQLNVQATGQPLFQVFAKTKNTFFLKVVDAQLTFTQNEAGETVSVTLHQGGRDMPGKKLKE